MRRLLVVGALALLAAPVATPTPGLALRPCSVAAVVARCGTISLPEDHARPGGKRISVGLAVITARRHVAGRAPLVVFAGGPGGSAIAAAGWSDGVFRATNRDLVLVDQRGVGRSSPLVCPKPPKEATIEDLPRLARSCIAGLKRDPRLLTTDQFVDDVDAVRAALGYPKVVLYGGSYGAAAVQVYVSRHGRRVEAAVVDGGTSLDVPIFERYYANGQRALEALAARCKARPACASAFPDVVGDVRSTLSRLRAAPATVGGQRVDAEAAATAFQQLTRTPEGNAALPRTAHAAARGDLGQLTRVVAQIEADAVAAGRLVMYWSITCSEPWAKLRPSAAAASAAGTYLGEVAAQDVKVKGIVCPLLARTPPPDTAAPPRSRVPVLALAGGQDPQDPEENITPLRRAMLRTTIVRVPGAGHGAVQYGCTRNVVARFLDSHRVTAADRACAARYLPLPFLTG